MVKKKGPKEPREHARCVQYSFQAVGTRVSVVGACPKDSFLGPILSSESSELGLGSRVGLSGEHPRRI